MLASVYGAPDAGNEWGLLLIHILTVLMHLSRSVIDGCLYFTTNNQLSKEKRGRYDSVWCTEYIVLLTWTDDIPYFGTDGLCEWFELEIVKHVPMKFQPECRDFISIECKQDLVRKVTELTQCAYWVGVAERFKDYLRAPFHVQIPLPQGVVVEPATDEEVEEAKRFPYRQLVGCMAFPSCHTKLEIRFAISLLGRFMQRWSMHHWGVAVHCLKYCIATREIGLMYSAGLDWHGVNVPYAYADSGFTAPRSQGCRATLMNGAVISLTSQKHSTVDVSTTGAELTEAFLASNDIVGFRNLLGELGFVLQAPTVLYQDNQPAIQIAEGRRNLASKTKHMDIRVWKLRERIDDQEIALVYCSTVDMLADIGTKALGPLAFCYLLGPLAFCYLRDCANGYALVRHHHPEYQMCALVVKLEDFKAAWGLSAGGSAGGSEGSAGQ
jgi:hypothetical protein